MSATIDFFSPQDKKRRKQGCFIQARFPEGLVSTFLEMEWLDQISEEIRPRILRGESFTLELNGRVIVSALQKKHKTKMKTNTIDFKTRLSPINRDAVKVFAKASTCLVSEDESTVKNSKAIPVGSLMSRCRSCGGLGYCSGWCFGCGKPISKAAYRQNSFLDRDNIDFENEKD